MVEQTVPEAIPARVDKAGPLVEVLAMLSLFCFPQILMAIQRQFVSIPRNRDVQPSATVTAWVGVLLCVCWIPALLFVANFRERDLRRFGLGVGVKWAYAL